ncbi:MAG: ATP phosphoribosyltransferase regulatory subunit [Anaerolineae bacterium]
MLKPTTLRGQLPRGVQDWFLADAAQRADLEARIAGVFRTWGYSRLIPPTFEYYENLALGLSAPVQEATYRFLDHRGHTLALRPDLTIQTARIVGTKLYDQPMPQRYFYVEPVFRYIEVQAGRQREFTQAGIELLGASTPAADAEVVALAVEALRAAGLTDFRVSIGHLDFFRALLTEAGLAPEAMESVQEAIDRKSRTSVRAALNGDHAPAAHALELLPSLVGGPEVLHRARALAPWPGAQAALDNLAAIYEWLARADMAAPIIIDLAEVRGMNYYTGLTFEAFASGMGFALLNGGRYDNLVGQFGRDCPSVGFALGVDRLMAALGEIETTSHLPDVVVAYSDDPACLAAVAQLRESGRRVEMDVLGRDEAALRSYAQARGIPAVLTWDGERLSARRRESER